MTDDRPFPYGGGTRDKPQPWVPENDPLRIALLGKLIEELNECGAIAARCLIQGIDEREPVTGVVNRHALEKELADVFAQAGASILRLGLDEPSIKVRLQKKTEFTGQWFDHLSQENDEGARAYQTRHSGEGR